MVQGLEPNQANVGLPNITNIRVLGSLHDHSSQDTSPGPHDDIGNYLGSYSIQTQGSPVKPEQNSIPTL